MIEREDAMTFSEFLNKLDDVGFLEGDSHSEKLAYLFSCCATSSALDDMPRNKEEALFFNPDKDQRSSASRLFNAVHGLSKARAKAIYEILDPETFESELSYFIKDSQDKAKKMRKAFEEAQIQSDESIEKTVVRVFQEILEERLFGEKGRAIEAKDIRVSKMYVAKNVIYINGKEIPLKTIKPPEKFDFTTRYVYCLYEAYVDALEKQKKKDEKKRGRKNEEKKDDSSYLTRLKTLPEDSKELPKDLQEYNTHFQKQNQYYYAAESVRRSLRGIMIDHEDQFNLLTKDAYECIQSTYEREYEDGLERLGKVLEKVSDEDLKNRSILTDIRNLIGVPEKKGLCHVMANGEIILSWVNIDNRMNGWIDLKDEDEDI